MHDPVSGRPAALNVLYEEIDQRCQAVADAGEPWPCRRGCDHCCRSLSEAPRLVRAEWRQLDAALDRLAPAVRAEIEAHSNEAAETTRGPVVCPFLDRDEGACRVYAARPAVCRTYGYYRSRDGGRFCHLVEAHVEAPDSEDTALGDSIVWGSQDAIDRHLDRTEGPTIPLAEWLRERHPR